MASLELLIGIGDLHGHHPALASLLKALQSHYSIFQCESRLKLNSGIRIVQTGDCIDRGSSNLKTIEDLRALKDENPDQFFQLFGNHELLALADLDIAREILEKEEENKMFQKYYEKSIHGYNGGLEFIREFGKTPREAFTAYLERLDRSGDIGRWMRTLNPLHLTQIGGSMVLFVHGGIPSSLQSMLSVEEYARIFKAHLKRPTGRGNSRDKYSSSSLVDKNSVFWDRSFNNLSDTEIDRTIERLGVKYVVIGHTPQPRITSYRNRIFNIDIGMSPSYGENTPSAIVFKPNGIFAFSVGAGESRIGDSEN